MWAVIRGSSAISNFTGAVPRPTSTPMTKVQTTIRKIRSTPPATPLRVSWRIGFGFIEALDLVAIVLLFTYLPVRFEENIEI